LTSSAALLDDRPMQKPASKKPTKTKAKTKDSLRKDVLRVMSHVRAGAADDGGNDV
jgi:hypothetical protein